MIESNSEFPCLPTRLRPAIHPSNAHASELWIAASAHSLLKIQGLLSECRVRCDVVEIT